MIDLAALRAVAQKSLDAIRLGGLDLVEVPPSTVLALLDRLQAAENVDNAANGLLRAIDRWTGPDWPHPGSEIAQAMAWLRGAQADFAALAALSGEGERT